MHTSCKLYTRLKILLLIFYWQIVCVYSYPFLRDLNARELAVLKTRNLKPMVDRFAVDAIALIVNQSSNDTINNKVK